MGVVALLLLLMLAAQAKGKAGGAHKAATSTQHAADDAHAAAAAASAQAAQTGDPVHAAQAADAAHNAQVLQAAANTQQAQARNTPPPWPQSVPAGLPPFPGPGWTPDSPPGPGVVARAWQLLPQLWSTGRPGVHKTEQTAGRWVTYTGAWMGNKKGVVAYRESGAPAPRPAPQRDIANA